MEPPKPPPPPPPPESAAAMPKIEAAISKQPEGNPALRAMGLPRIRAKLPSRNWTIFLTLTGSFITALTYDRYQSKLALRKWTNLVSPLASQPLSPDGLPRKVTVYLAAPPGDGISPAREHFRDYVKPVLNAAAVDFEVVEGRQMGELRAKVAEEVRGRRRGERLASEGGGGGVEGGEVGGVVVVGRHAWKEYLRGVQEGWLGPTEAPSVPIEAPKVERLMADSAETPVDDSTAAKDGGDNNTETTVKKPDEDSEKKTPKFAPEYISPASYSLAPDPENLPAHLPAAGLIPFQHLLGFLNTPTRLYRFLTRRHLVDSICREAAAVALGQHRPFITAPAIEGTMTSELDIERALATPLHGLGELGEALKTEEKDWVRRVWKEDNYKGVWTEGVGVDERLGLRMRRYFVASDHEPAQIETTWVKETFGGWRKWWMNEDEGEPKVVVGNLDDVDA